MRSYIDSVRSNLTAFSLYLESNDINLKIAVVEFQDITWDGENSTVIHTFSNNNMWTSDTSEVENVLASLEIGDGGDIPETPMQAITKFTKTVIYSKTEAEKFRTRASRFAFLLTDAEAKDITGDVDTRRTDGKEYIPDTESLIAFLRRNSIYTSVVSKTECEENYHDLYTQTGGKFIDITSDNYYELMLEIADWIVEYRDTDGDGLLDIWETEGVDVNGVHVDLPGMGADPNSPDIFVYYDWMYREPRRIPVVGISVGGEINLKPTPATLEAVASQFRNHGIRLHLIEGQAIPYEFTFDLGKNYENWNRTAAEYFPSKYWTIARYCMFVNMFDGIDTVGLAEAIPGQFFSCC